MIPIVHISFKGFWNWLWFTEIYNNGDISDNLCTVNWIFTSLLIGCLTVHAALGWFHWFRVFTVIFYIFLLALFVILIPFYFFARLHRYERCYGTWLIIYNYIDRFTSDTILFDLFIGIFYIFVLFVIGGQI